MPRRSAPHARAPGRGRAKGFAQPAHAAHPAGAAARRQPTETPWDRASRWYDNLVGERGSEFQQAVVIPGAVRLLAVKKGEKLLDLACGQGVLSRALHDQGAMVTGVDLSEQLIEFARARSARGIRYLVGDATHLAALPSGEFDAVACVLALQNMEAPQSALGEVARLLRPGGRLVAVVMHPAFRIPRQTRWGWDEERKLLFRQVDRYLSPLKIPVDVRPFHSPGKTRTWTYHRPLQDYVKALTDNGLVLNAVEEWPSHKTSQPGPAADAENRARQEFPLFLAFRALKPESSAHLSTSEGSDHAAAQTQSPRP